MDMFPFLNYYEESCNKYENTGVSLTPVLISFPLNMYLDAWSHSNGESKKVDLIEVESGMVVSTRWGE